MMLDISVKQANRITEIMDRFTDHSGSDIDYEITRSEFNSVTFSATFDSAMDLVIFGQLLGADKLVNPAVELF